ncbi:HAD family hydrolase [Oricola cellulosilytica]|uniref:HAD family phosphatase n=1 Tax=Oricola cellulosilytica TaxID=1429082 RepID=A0A4R0PHL5_9HYPH|nr:HAD family phosphatase [Oricola cellulosilytica]TCD16264.1 HAD family phosphatase [Oricola cellulosilytica]
MQKPLLIFDCDGVLIDSEAIYLDVEFAFLEGKGVRVDREWYVREFLALAQDLWRAKLSDLVAEHTGNPMSDNEYTALKAESRRRVAEEVRTIAGVETLLERLKATRCVASSTQLPFLGPKLERAGLARYFGDGVYSGDMVENGKPAPDLFQHAASEMGYRADDCIVVEDSANGVRGGKAAGHHVIGFTGGTHCLGNHAELLRGAGADIVVSSHVELAEWLAENTGAFDAR